MFWNRSSNNQKEDVREYVRDRLRLALDFATLGAYELSDHELPGDGDHELRGDLGPRTAGDRTEATRQTGRASKRHPCREIRGASRPSRAHVEVATGAAWTCAELESDHRCSALGNAGTARSGRAATRTTGLRRSRGGEVAAPQQPCTWVER